MSGQFWLLLKVLNLNQIVCRVIELNQIELEHGGNWQNMDCATGTPHY